MDTSYKRMDKRTIERYREKGLISDKDYENFLKNLPDEEASAQWVQMDLHDAEIGGEGEGSEGDTDEGA